MGKVYSHLSEEERQVIQIEVGNGTSVRKIARLLGRGPSGISREIRRNTWFPSNESESYRPYRPKRLKTGPWTGRYYIAGPAQRKADRRRAKPRKPYRLSFGRLWSRVAGQRHHPPLPAQTHDHRTRYGKRAPGDRRRDRQPSHARARPPHARRGIRRRAAKLARQTRMSHF